MSKCKSCIEGPKGLEGHQDLFVTTMSRGPMQFRCRVCETKWMRNPRDGSVQWAEATGTEQGAMVPNYARNRS